MNKIKKCKKLPKFIQSLLWFSDINKIDMEEDYERIILNVLNYGDLEAMHWLFECYSKNIIKNIVKKYGKGELSDKSLNYWMLILKINKKDLVKTRF